MARSSRRDQLHHLGDLGPERIGDAGHDFLDVARFREEIGHRAVAERQADLETHVRRDDAFLLERAEDRVGVDRVARVAEPPTRIAEPHLLDAGLDPERELVVAAARLPPFDAVVVGRRPFDGFDLGMPVKDPVGQAVDPVTALADLAVGHIGEPRTERRTDLAKSLFGGLDRNASNQQQFPGHLLSHIFAICRMG